MVLHLHQHNIGYTADGPKSEGSIVRKSDSMTANLNPNQILSLTLVLAG